MKIRRVFNIENLITTTTITKRKLDLVAIRTYNSIVAMIQRVILFLSKLV